MAWRNCGDAAAPCAIDGTDGTAASESIDQVKYPVNFDASISVRAGMHPLNGLNVSWASFEPTVRSQLAALIGSGAPFGSVNPSTTVTKAVSEPGCATQPIWSTTSFLTNSPYAQSPI